ncbi:YeeE/YedE family protein [Peptostreptococcus equinus]|uniref:YeeE/YedE family protein n=1 Tax=Peptostreptococcus equinus TaxID=3003601 RepID=A0ABY7JNE0_9FIRM|nr:YeeE/YedE family protein [Peptostreptococcus sp. CBA3647]WAW14893.1 YeeE/YedE family protein [Peptostreptococcus sp. CBA3647]
MNKRERIIGFILILLSLVFGRFYLESDILFFRLVIGIGLGYTLTRGYSGFAGSINRSFRTGSTRLLRTMMFMFFITALMSTAVLFKHDPSKFDLWINPINTGLLLGGILFGFGMAFSSCCASGVLTDLVTGLPRAIITLIFFCFGVFIGFPIQNSQAWVNKSIISSPTGTKIGYGGIYLPDLFKFDGLEGYLGAMILTGCFCFLVVYISYKYESNRKKNNTYFGHASEEMQLVENNIGEFDTVKHSIFSEEMYKRIFVRSWTLKTAAIIIAVIFTILMGVTKAGWGASTPYGLWFGKFLMLFGVSSKSLSNFTLMPDVAFSMPFFSHPINVQNFGIVVGTAMYLLTAGIFKQTFYSELKINSKEALFYVLGGFSMGFGTRLSNGCNVGALYTPIANFSLSGWIFLVFLAIGGILGNILAKKVNL